MKTYKDIYQFPLKDYHGMVYDSKNNFVFQFEFYDEEKQKLALNVINGKENLKNPDLKFKHTGGLIHDLQENGYILIRGWGNLTGIGAHNLPPE